MRADLTCQIERLVPYVDGHDSRGGRRSQDLHGHVAESANADDHARSARPQPPARDRDRVIRRQAGVGERDVLHRVEVAERHEVTRTVDDEVLRHGSGSTEARRGDAEGGGDEPPSLGVPQPENFRERIVVAYSTVTAVRQSTLTLLEARKISPDDAENINTQADTARAGIEIARTLEGTSPSAASERLAAAIAITEALQAYLRTRQ